MERFPPKTWRIEKEVDLPAAPLDKIWIEAPGRVGATKAAPIWPTESGEPLELRLGTLTVKAEEVEAELDQFREANWTVSEVSDSGDE